ncbi:MAG: YqaE/Pmp3 family membrane protein [Bacteroidia bacterium]|nr:YqaE/Pmp3 family membrane protein [Bacteroidia bacterium]
MSLLMIILTFFIPPVAVAMKHGVGSSTFWINLVLTLLAWLPGMIHGFLVNSGSGSRHIHA